MITISKSWRGGAGEIFVQIIFHVISCNILFLYQKCSLYNNITIAIQYSLYYLKLFYNLFFGDKFGPKLTPFVFSTLGFRKFSRTSAGILIFQKCRIQSSLFFLRGRGHTRAIFTMSYGSEDVFGIIPAPADKRVKPPRHISKFRFVIFL